MSRLLYLVICLACHPAVAETLSGPVRVIDGDTLVLGKHRIRLKSIDAPELRQTCQTAAGEDYPCGLVARQQLVNLINQQVVYCDVEVRDLYDRWLGLCYTLSQSDLNHTMVQDGWALVRYFNHSSQNLWDAMLRAKADRRGLWSGKFEYPWIWRKQKSSLQPQ